LTYTPTPSLTVEPPQAIAASEKPTKRSHIVHATAGDQCGRGIVASFARPGGKRQGVKIYGAQKLSAKRGSRVFEGSPPRTHASPIRQRRNPYRQHRGRNENGGSGALGWTASVHGAGTGDLREAFAGNGQGETECVDRSSDDRSTVRGCKYHRACEQAHCTAIV